MSTKELITRLGGPAAVGRWFGIRSQAVSLWKEVPLERVPGMLEMAASQGLSLSAQDVRPDYDWPRVCGA